MINGGRRRITILMMTARVLPWISRFFSKKKLLCNIFKTLGKHVHFSSEVQKRFNWKIENTMARNLCSVTIMNDSFWAMSKVFATEINRTGNYPRCRVWANDLWWKGKDGNTNDDHKDSYRNFSFFVEKNISELKIMNTLSIRNNANTVASVLKFEKNIFW